MKYVLLMLLLLPGILEAAQDDEILGLARDVIERVRFGALITVDANGQARSRIVDAFKPDHDFVIHVATRPNTRKIAQLRLNPSATLFYFDPEDKNYVSIMGQAELIEDEATKIRMRREADSDGLYPNFPDDYLLIRIKPLWLEGILPGYRGDRENWRPVKVNLGGSPDKK